MGTQLRRGDVPYVFVPKECGPVKTSVTGQNTRSSECVFVCFPISSHAYVCVHVSGFFTAAVSIKLIYPAVNPSLL